MHESAVHDVPSHGAHCSALLLAFHPTSGVARICREEGQSWKLGHGALTVDFMAGCSSGLMTKFCD